MKIVEADCPKCGTIISIFENCKLVKCPRCGEEVVVNADSPINKLVNEAIESGKDEELLSNLLNKK